MTYKITFFRVLALFLFVTTSVFSYAQSLVVTTVVCNNNGGSEVRMTGPWWSWDPNGGPLASDNGDGTYTFTLDPAPTADMEYLLVLDGVNVIIAMPISNEAKGILLHETYPELSEEFINSLTNENNN